MFIFISDLKSQDSRTERNLQIPLLIPSFGNLFLIMGLQQNTVAVRVPLVCFGKMFVDKARLNTNKFAVFGRGCLWLCLSLAWKVLGAKLSECLDAQAKIICVVHQTLLFVILLCFLQDG